MRNGKLVVIEGPDGSGKSTLAKLLIKGKDQNNKVLVSFPGNERGELGELVYRLHHNSKEFGIGSITDAALQTMHLAAHLDAIEKKINPLLETGNIVVLDRFWWSIWVYGSEAKISPRLLEQIINIEKSFWGKILPDILFLVDRRISLRMEMDPQKWQKLRALYQNLVIQEASKYPVERISNDSTEHNLVRSAEEILVKQKILI
jgi:thymidylate kinase